MGHCGPGCGPAGSRPVTVRSVLGVPCGPAGVPWSEASAGKARDADGAMVAAAENRYPGPEPGYFALVMASGIVSKAMLLDGAARLPASCWAPGSWLMGR